MQPLPLNYFSNTYSVVKDKHAAESNMLDF